jgi:hypothetical protein
MARRYHEDSRASAELDPVFRKMWEDSGKDVLPRAEAWVREAAPAIVGAASASRASGCRCCGTPDCRAH